MKSRGTTVAARCLVGVLALTCAAQWLPAQDQVPADFQAAILIRVLSYDRAVKRGAGNSVVVGIVAKSEDRSSTQAQAGLAKALSALQSGWVQGLTLKVVTTDYKDAADLAAWVAEKNVQMLYVSPGLSKELEGIRGVCVDKKIASITSVRDFVERGLVAGIVLKGERPGILVNLKAAMAAGRDLDPALLTLSEVIR